MPTQALGGFLKGQASTQVADLTLHPARRPSLVHSPQDVIGRFTVRTALLGAPSLLRSRLAPVRKTLPVLLASLLSRPFSSAHSFPLGESPLWSAFLPMRILLFSLLAYNQFIHPRGKCILTRNGISTILVIIIVQFLEKSEISLNYRFPSRSGGFLLRITRYWLS